MNKLIHKKVIIILLILIILLGFGFASLIYLDNSIVRKVDISDMKKNVADVQFTIDSVNNDENSNYISIRGWALKKGANISTVECYVGLINTSTNEYYKLNTVKEDRPDVTSHFNDGFNYDKSGLYSQFSMKRVEKGKYEIVLLYLSDNNNILVHTGKTISIL